MVNPRHFSGRHAPRKAPFANERGNQGDTKFGEVGQFRRRSFKKRLEHMSVPSLEALLQDVIVDRTFFDRINVIQQLGDLLDQVKATMSYTRNAAFLPQAEKERIIIQMSDTGWIPREFVRKVLRPRNQIRQTGSRDKLRQGQRPSSRAAAIPVQDSLSSASLKESRSASELLEAAGYLSPSNSEKGKNILSECNHALDELITGEVRSSLHIFVQRKDSPVPIRTKPKERNAVYRENRTSRLRHELVHNGGSGCKLTSENEGHPGIWKKPVMTVTRCQPSSGTATPTSAPRIHPPPRRLRSSEQQLIPCASKESRPVTLRQHLSKKEIMQSARIELAENVAEKLPGGDANLDSKSRSQIEMEENETEKEKATTDDNPDRADDTVNPGHSSKDDLESVSDETLPTIATMSYASLQQSRSEKSLESIESIPSSLVFECDDDDEDAGSLMEEILKFRICAELTACDSSAECNLHTTSPNPSNYSSNYSCDFPLATSSEYFQSFAPLQRIQSKASNISSRASMPQSEGSTATISFSESSSSVSSHRCHHDGQEKIVCALSPVTEDRPAELQTSPSENQLNQRNSSAEVSTTLAGPEVKLAGSITLHEPCEAVDQDVSSGLDRNDVNGFLTVVPDPLHQPEIFGDNHPAVRIDNVCSHEAPEVNEDHADGDPDSRYSLPVQILDSSDLLPGESSHSVLLSVDTITDNNGNISVPDDDRESCNSRSWRDDRREKYSAIGVPDEPAPEEQGTFYSTVMDYVQGLVSWRR